MKCTSKSPVPSCPHVDVCLRQGQGPMEVEGWLTPEDLLSERLVTRRQLHEVLKGFPRSVVRQLVHGQIPVDFETLCCSFLPPTFIVLAVSFAVFGGIEVMGGGGG